ncbi:MAG: hypothetical protein K8T90_15460 [Planctomycetes bacterium]|nr:hypothetical protein [Planctomycetota bacterium]
MDPILFHLRVNHFPIILAMVAVAAMGLAVVAKKDSFWGYGLVTMLIAAVSTPIAYWTGRGAEEVAGASEVLDLEAMGEHEDSAVWALIALLVAGIASGVALARPKPMFRWIAIGTALVATALVLWTGKQAGQIAHGKYTMTLLDK